MTWICGGRSKRNSNTHPDAAAVGVAAHHGVVTLTGHVPSLDQKRMAEVRAQWVRGFHAVVQDLEVRLPSAEMQSGAAIAARAHCNADVERLRIQIKVQGSKVTLSGTAHTWHEQHLAEQAAWSTTGVTGRQSNPDRRLI